MLRAGGESTFVGTADAVRLWSVVLIRQLTPVFITVVMFVVLRLTTRRQSVAIAIGMVGIFFAWSEFGPAPVRIRCEWQSVRGPLTAPRNAGHRRDLPSSQVVFNHKMMPT